MHIRLRIWLRALVRRVVRDEDRVLLEEAARCLKSGALRAAYIMTWVSVAESLKAKLKEMSYRDSEIARTVGEIEQREAQRQSADRLILERSEHFGLVRSEDGRRLSHLFDMRSVFAHPYSQAPTMEEVKAALVVSVDAVLSQPAFLREGYINEMLDLVFTHKSYVDDLESKSAAAATDISRRVLPELHPYLLQKLVGRLASILDDPDAARFRRRATWFARAYLRGVGANLRDEKWDIVSLTTKFPQSTAEILAYPDLWESVPEQAQDILVGSLLEGEPQEHFSYDPGRRIPIQNLDRILRLDKANRLNQRQQERLKEALDDSPLQLLAMAGVGANLYVDRLIAMLASHNWYTQNVAMSALRTAGAQSLLGCDDSVETVLGRNVLQAAEGTAGDAMEFMSALGSGKETWPSPFIRGVLLECFVDDENQVRFKTLHMKDAILGSIRAARPPMTDEFEDLAARLQEAKPKYAISSVKFDETISALMDASSQLTRDEEAFGGQVGRIVDLLKDRKASLVSEPDHGW